MTVASETNRSGPYIGNGVTTVFDYEFRIISQTHLRVLKTVTATGVETTLTLDADYTVSGVGAAEGGQITALAAPVAGETITILRKVPFVQETDLENQGAYYAETVETVADLATMRDQELSEGLGRTLQVGPSQEPIGALPEPSPGLALAWHATERKLINAPVAAGDVAAAIVATQALRDQTSGLKADVVVLKGQTQDIRDGAATDAAATIVTTHADVALTHADVITGAAALASAQAARDASLYGKGIFPTTAAAIGLGVKGHGTITPGSGGANGIFDLAFTGGTGSGATGKFLVQGGALVDILHFAPGSYTVAPTFSFAASAGLTGAASTVVLGPNVAVGEYFWTEVSAGILGLHNVTAGPIAADTGIRAATSALVSTVARMMQVEGFAVQTFKMVEAAGSGTPSLFRSNAFVAGQTLEHVVVAKAAERRFLQLTHAGVGAAYTANFDLVDGTVSASGANLVSASIRTLGAGWYECKATVLVATNVTNNVQTRMSATGVFPYVGDGASGLYITSIVLQLLSTTTNLFPSSDPTNAAFTKQNCTVVSATTAESLVLPPLALVVDATDIIVGGKMTGTKVVEQSGSGSPALYQAQTVTIGDVVVFKSIAKKGERSLLNLFSNASAIFNCTFDLNAGTCSGTGATIALLGNGWYECTVTVTATASGSTNWQHRLFSAAAAHPYVGDGVSGLYLQESSLSINGGANKFTSAKNLSTPFWTVAAGVTRVANAARYLGLLSDPAALAATAKAQADLLASIDYTVNGKMIATKLVELSGSGNPSVWQPRTALAIGQVVRLEVIAKKGERNRLNLFSNSGARYDVTFNLDLGTYTVNPTFAAPTVTMTKLGNNWFKIVLTKTVDVAGGMNPQHRIYPASGGHPYVGDGVSGLYVYTSSFKVDGGSEVNLSPADLSVSPWTSSAGVTRTPNAALYLGLLSDPSTLGGGSAYDDGSAALLGRRQAALGSSITIGAYYAALLAEMLGLVLTNLGVSGSALGLSTTGYPSYGMSARVADIPLDTELVTLEPGPNAFGAQETPLGAFGDTTYATHYGSLWKVLLDIRARVPNAKIVMIGTYSGGPGHATHRLGRTNGQGNTMDQFMKAEREVCQALGVPYIDISQSGMGYLTSTLYMFDELHPSAAGSLRHATYDAEDLRKMARHGLFVN